MGVNSLATEASIEWRRISRFHFFLLDQRVLQVALPGCRLVDSLGGRVPTCADTRSRVVCMPSKHHDLSHVLIHTWSADAFVIHLQIRAKAKRDSRFGGGMSFQVTPPLNAVRLRDRAAMVAHY
jgi:hypothetical protein